MKKIIYLMIIAAVVSAQNIEVKLFSKLFTSLFDKKPVYVYTEVPKYQHLHNIFLKNTNVCSKADIVLGTSKHCNNKPKFLLDYYNYVEDKNALGAFYWRKGRPQLRLRKNIIEKYHLHIAPDFKEFLE